MALLVTSGSQMMCSVGLAPSVLNVLPVNRVMCGNKPAANIMDNVSMLNIMPFGMCTSLANPQVAAATAAKLGVLTLVPCIPAITGPWTPGSPTVLSGGRPAVNHTCKLMCAHAGVIQITAPVQGKTLVP